MLATPQIIETTEQTTAVIHLTVPRTEIAKVMGPAIGEILATLAKQGMTPTGPCYSFHWKRPTDIFDFELGFPVSQTVTAVGRVKPGSLPAARTARTTYQGGFEGLGAAWGEFLAWIDDAGLKPQECLWEAYVRGHETSPDPQTWQTQLNRPLLG